VPTGSKLVILTGRNQLLVPAPCGQKAQGKEVNQAAETNTHGPLRRKTGHIVGLILFIGILGALNFLNWQKWSQDLAGDKTKGPIGLIRPLFWIISTG
jgi:hypothetical protein